MKVKEIEVTPAMAQRWLNENNTNNRKIYPTTVEAYARDMKHGKWELNNQAIAFDEDGNLLDGQHRLMAIVWSGTTVPMLTVRGLPKSAQETVDRNKPRSIGDVWEIADGTKNARLKVSVVNVLAELCTVRRFKMTASIAKEIYRLYEGEMEAVIAERKNVPKLIYAPTLGSFVFAAKVFKAETIEFEKKYFTGEELKRGDPILTFRNFMLNREHSVGGCERRMVSIICLTALKYYIEQQAFNRISRSNAGYEFFAHKQKKNLNAVTELFEY